MRLNDLAVKYNTDKGEHAHNYTPVYSMYLDQFQDLSFNFLEIGVYEGASIKMWKEYFKKGKIVAIDINPQCKNFIEDRIDIEIGDQTDEEFLKNVHAKYGQFSVILDDGGHSNKQQITSFEVLFPLLSPGGIYIVEDLHCSYVKNSVWDDYYISGIDYFKQLVDKVNLFGKSFTGYKEIAGQKLDYYEKNIEYIHFYKSVCVIAKKEYSL
jgi:hypothetical protein